MNRTWTTTAIAVAVICGAGRAAAQDVDVRVTISPEIIRQIQTLVPQIQREVNRTVQHVVPQVQREVNRAVENIGPEVQREIGSALRDIAAGIATARTASGAFTQNRDFRSEQTQRETRNLQLGATGALDLRNISGDIKVTAGSARDVTIEIVRVSRGRTDADARRGLDEVTVAVDQRGDRATVESRYPNQRGRSPYDVSVTYTVTAPAGTRVTVSSVGGNIAISGIHGDVAAANVGGNVTLSDAGRVTSAKTVGGNVTITDAQGDANLDAGTIGGNVSLERVKARRVSVSVVGGNVTARDVTCDGADLGTMSGSVEFSGPLARNGRYEMHTQSGTVRFSPTGTTGFELQANTFSGAVRTEIPLQLQGRMTGRGPQRAVRGTFGDGSAVVIATSFSGDVIVIKK